MIQFINGMNDPYIFSLHPFILVYKVHNGTFCDHVSADLMVTPSPKLNPCLKGDE